MKLRELIAELKALEDQYGDLEVVSQVSKYDADAVKSISIETMKVDTTCWLPGRYFTRWENNYPTLEQVISLKGNGYGS